MSNISFEAEMEKIITVKEERIQELLTKCMKGWTPTVEEQKLLEHWYDTFPEYKKQIFDSAIEKDRIKMEIKAEIFKQIDKQIPMSQKIHSKRRFIFPELVIRVATAILILIFLGGVWFLLSK